MEPAPCVLLDRGRPLRDDCGGRAACPEEVLPWLVKFRNTKLGRLWFARPAGWFVGFGPKAVQSASSNARHALRWRVPALWRQGTLSLVRLAESGWRRQVPRTGPARESPEAVVGDARARMAAAAPLPLAIGRE